MGFSTQMQTIITNNRLIRNKRSDRIKSKKLYDSLREYEKKGQTKTLNLSKIELESRKQYFLENCLKEERKQKIRRVVGLLIGVPLLLGILDLIFT